jgi:hypothetical protein
MSESKNVRRSKRHVFFQNEMFKFFHREGFVVERNYTLKFRFRYRSGKKKDISKVISGLIDIYAAPYDIAIVFDSGKLINWKSIEKLIQCNADYCFGIILGSKNEDQNFKKCIERIKQVCRETLDTKKNIEYFKERIKNIKFFLGIIAIDFLKPINLRKLLNHDLNDSNVYDFFCELS